MIGWFLGLSLLVPAPAADPDQDVAAIVERAEAYFLDQKYAESSEMFSNAFEISGQPKYLYARAQAERLGGNCTLALQLYDRFLATQPAEPAAGQARVNRERCERVVPDVEEVPPPPPEAEPDPSSPPPRDERLMRAWYRDPWGGALVGSGVVLTAVGGGVLGLAISGDRDAPDASTEDAFIDDKDQARVQQRAGIAVVSIGAALVVAGAIRWAIVGTRARRSNTAWEARVDRYGAGAALRGRF
jgi:tetratricopeptide (TPR) repeat protein